MSEYIFCFDLDATVTKVEILPEIAKALPQDEMGEKMRRITERTMAGELPFEESFRSRVNILLQVPVSTVREIIARVPVHEEMVSFIREHADRCYIVTGNLDVWICDLMERMGLSPDHVLCSHATVVDDKIVSVDEVIDKGKAITALPRPFAAIGDGNNDAEMVGAADVGIGFGGVREIAPSVLNNATHAVYTEEKLCQFLRRLL